MEADCRTKRHADARHVQCHGASEAVADGGSAPGVHPGLFQQGIQAGPEPSGADGHVPQHRIHRGAGLVRRCGSIAIAVHVDCKRAISLFRQLIGATADIVVQTPPFVNHHDARPRSFKIAVPGQVPDMIRCAAAIVDGL